MESIDNKDKFRYYRQHIWSMVRKYRISSLFITLSIETCGIRVNIMGKSLFPLFSCRIARQTSIFGHPFGTNTIFGHFSPVSGYFSYKVIYT